MVKPCVIPLTFRLESNYYRYAESNISKVLASHGKIRKMFIATKNGSKYILSDDIYVDPDLEELNMTATSVMNISRRKERTKTFLVVRAYTPTLRIGFTYRKNSVQLHLNTKKYLYEGMRTQELVRSIKRDIFNHPHCTETIRRVITKNIYSLITPRS